MSDQNHTANRFVLLRPINGHSLIVGHNKKIPSRLIDVSTVGSRVILLPPLRAADELSRRLNESSVEIISVFQHTLGMWKINLLVRTVTPDDVSYSIWGDYAKVPMLHPVQGLLNFSA